MTGRREGFTAGTNLRGKPFVRTEKLLDMRQTLFTFVRSMASKRLDLFGKNLVLGVLDLRGGAVAEVEIPPTDSLRIDLWFVPDEVKQRMAPAFAGVLGEIASMPAVLELWSDVVSEREFLDSYYKRHAWLRVLETREKRVWPLPGLWHLSAGRPNTVIKRFGLRPVKGSSGWYRTRDAGWHVNLVVISELPRTRETVLLRLLGRKRVRLQAMREIVALAEDAWEKDLAHEWLSRLELYVRDPVTPLHGEEKELVMNMLEAGRERTRRLRAELTQEIRQELRQELRQEVEEEVKRKLAQGFKRQLKQQLEQELKQQLEQKLKQQVERQREQKLKRQVEQQLEQQREQLLIDDRARLVERRVGRKLGASERATLANRVRELGPERVMDIALDYAPAELAAWLKA